MTEIVVAVVLCIGTLFLLLAALAAIRMPDAYTRLSASTKAVTFGASTMFLAVAVFFAWEPSMTRAIAGIAFLFATAPVGAHVLARQAHRIGQPLWRGSLADELVRDQITTAWSTPHPGLGTVSRDAGRGPVAGVGDADEHTGAALLVIPAERESDRLLRAHAERLATLLDLHIAEAPLAAVRALDELDQDPVGWARSLLRLAERENASFVAVPGDDAGLASQFTGRSRSLALANESTLPLFVIGPQTRQPRTATPYRVIIPATSAGEARPLLAATRVLSAREGAPIEIVVAGFALPALDDSGENPAQQALAAELDRLAREVAGPAQVTVTVDVFRPGGRLPVLIAQAAATHPADLVVLGYRHRGPLGRLIAGHTALDVLRSLTCAALLVPLRDTGGAVAPATTSPGRTPPEPRG